MPDLLRTHPLQRQIVQQIIEHLVQDGMVVIVPDSWHAAMDYEWKEH
jgi:hypothetical protein